MPISKLYASVLSILPPDLNKPSSQKLHQICHPCCEILKGDGAGLLEHQGFYLRGY